MEIKRFESAGGRRSSNCAPGVLISLRRAMMAGRRQFDITAVHSELS